MSSSINRPRILANVILQLVALVTIFVLANYLGFKHFKRWDYSRDQKYTLSEQTRQMLASLNQPVEMILYFAQASPIHFDSVTLAKEFAAHSNGKVHVEIVNPYLSSSRAHEISRQHKLGSQENVIILTSEDRTQVINEEKMVTVEPSLNPNDPPRIKAFIGEQAITGAMIAVSETGSNKLYYTAGHGEADLSEEDFYGLVTFLQRQNVEIAPLKLMETGRVPEDARLVFIVGPAYDFSEEEVAALRTYWERKGRIFAFLSPDSVTPRLDSLVHSLGVTPRNDQVLRTAPINDQLTAVSKQVAGDFLPGHPITERLNNVTALLHGVTRSLVPDAQRVTDVNIRLTPLVEAAQGFWGESRYQATDGIYFDANEDIASPVVAVAIEQGAVDDKRVQVDSSRMVVIGNSASLANNTLTTANLDFVLSCVNWLLARDSLIGVTPKDMRNFTLSMKQEQLSRLALIVMGGIPGAAAVLGLFVWVRRRR